MSSKFESSLSWSLPLCRLELRDVVPFFFDRESIRRVFCKLTYFLKPFDVYHKWTRHVPDRSPLASFLVEDPVYSPSSGGNESSRGQDSCLAVFRLLVDGTTEWPSMSSSVGRPFFEPEAC